jgi:hypothetical protein
LTLIVGGVLTARLTLDTGVDGGLLDSGPVVMPTLSGERSVVGPVTGSMVITGDSAAARVIAAGQVETNQLRRATRQSRRSSCSGARYARLGCAEYDQ